MEHIWKEGETYTCKIKIMIYFLALQKACYTTSTREKNQHVEIRRKENEPPRVLKERGEQIFYLLLFNLNISWHG